jgi:hypothetical protein
MHRSLTRSTTCLRPHIKADRYSRRRDVRSKRGKTPLPALAFQFCGFIVAKCGVLNCGEGATELDWKRDVDQYEGGVPVAERA